MIDFNRLRSDPTAQREPFEGLICGLARRSPPTAGATFNWIAGAGGDGGVEAYWVTPNGDEFGYQAKYHLRSGDIDWGKIDGSVEAALAAHPQLIRYIVAVACDLTDTVPGRGKSGRAHWNTHKLKWEAAASERGMSVAFEFWGASEIEDRLTRPNCQGLRSYWLGELELDRNWFRSAFENASVLLDERYQPDDHVEVTAERTFGGLLRDGRLHRRLSTAIEGLGDVILNEAPHLGLSISAALQVVRTNVNALGGVENVVPVDPTTRVDLEPLRRHTSVIEKAVGEVATLLRSQSRENETEQSKEDSRRIYASVSSVLDHTRTIRAFVESDVVRADDTRFVLATGHAGTGKSHILAAEVDSLTAHGIPAVMVLGTQFFDGGPLAQQVPAALGLDATWDAFLDTMNAAAEAAGARGLIAIDAINEGGGRRWQDELLVMARNVAQRPWLALVVSCRTEYAPYLVSNQTEAEATALIIKGFTTDEERERAAQVYLDRRGILRPATPWLSPEFTNPLFLRTTANALHREGASEYPTGLHGTKRVMSFYLNSIGRNLGTDRDGSDELIGPLLRAVRSVAREIAEARSDHLLPGTARDRIAEAFAGHPAPTSMTWLDILHRNGILRRDPPPPRDAADPLDIPDDVIRFGFQRFQDYLVAEALHDENTPSTAAFAEGGALDFMIERRGDHAWLAREWRTIMQALWIVHIEKGGGELIDLLPEDVADSMVDDFVETLLWRAPTAFTDRTFELFDAMLIQDEEYRPGRYLDVLLRFGLRDHPWNADFLDRRLRPLPMPERDAFWTLPLAELGWHDIEDSGAHHLARWCNGPVAARAGDDILARALVMLGWMFSSTDRMLRDVATKGAIAILVDRPTLLPDFVRRFAGVDDPYVVERVAAACAGACLRDSATVRLSETATAIHEAFFEHDVPTHLLTRDYARSIIERAQDLGCLSGAIPIDRCRPPYHATLPEWPASKEVVEARSEKVGDRHILSSCTGWSGDFGRYVVKGRVSDFATVPLSDTPSTLISGAAASDRWSLLQDIKQDDTSACLWVADRALSLGWTKALFPNDFGVDRNRHHGPRIERIGKKYQWIAYHELLARLADNFWIIDEYRPPLLHRYDTPNDVPFIRDIEITLPPLADGTLPVPPEAMITPVEIKEVPEEAWEGWVFENDLPERRLLGGSRTFADCDAWCVLYRYSSVRSAWPDGETSDIGSSTRQEEFWFQTMIGLPPGEASSAADHWKAREIDFHDWLPQNQTDRGYLHELGTRNTWNESKLGPDRGWGDDVDAFHQFTTGYHWEGHLDGTLPRGLELHLPSPWLVTGLGLKAASDRPGVFINAEGAAIILCTRHGGSTLCVVRRMEIDALLLREGLEPTWLGIGERSVYPLEKDEAGFRRRRWNGVFMPQNEGGKTVIWFKDHDHSVAAGDTLHTMTSAMSGDER